MTKNIPNLTQRKNGKWYLRVQVHGKDKWKSFGADKKAASLAALEYNKRKASAKLTQDNEELEKLFAVKPKMTFAEAAKQYMDARHDLKASTLQNYENYLDNYLLPIFGSLEIRMINEDDIQTFLNGLSERFSSKHCNDILRLANAICNVQLKRERISRNPFALIRLLRQSDKTPEQQPDPLTIDETELVIESLPEHWKPLFTVLAQTGMRPSEAFALRWGDIDWKRSRIRINKARVKGHEDTPKTRSSIREVEVIKTTILTLRQLKNQRDDCLDNDYIFIRADGKPFDKYVDGIWANALKKVGIRHRPCYQLRHSYICNCLLDGIELVWIAQQVGHSNLKMIYEVYARYIRPRSEKDYNIGRVELLFSRKKSNSKGRSSRRSS